MGTDRHDGGSFPNYSWVREFQGFVPAKDSSYKKRVRGLFHIVCHIADCPDHLCRLGIPWAPAVSRYIIWFLARNATNVVGNLT